MFVCMTAYGDEILFTLNSMSSLLENILTPNRAKAYEYLEITRRVVVNTVLWF